MREQYRILKRCLCDLDVSWRKCAGGKHPKIVLTVDGQEIRVPYSLSRTKGYTTGVNTAKSIRLKVEAMRASAIASHDNCHNARGESL